MNKLNKTSASRQLGWILGMLVGGAQVSWANTGASFLKLGVGARALGLGSAYTAIADDVSALYWNPAGLARLEKKELSAMHAQLFAQTRYDFLGYAHPIGNHLSDTSQTVFGVGAAYLSQGSLEGRAEDRTPTPDFDASDLAVTLGAARSNLSLPLGRGRIPLSLGMNVKLLQSRISGFSATGFAFDVGTVLHPSPLIGYPLVLGLAIQNVGPKMQFLDEAYALPLTLAAGVAAPLAQYHVPITLSADLKHQPYDHRTGLSVGMEFSPVSMLALRAGYLTHATRAANAGAGRFDQISNVSGLGLGMGFKLGPSTVDYAFTPSGEMGNSQRVSLSLKF